MKNIDHKIRTAKEAFLKTVEPFCSACGTTSDRLDCSHTVSVDRCKKMGKPELAYDIRNFKLNCRSCHNIYDGGAIQEKVKLKDFGERLEFIRNNDPQRYISLSIAMKDL